MNYILGGIIIIMIIYLFSKSNTSNIKDDSKADKTIKPDTILPYKSKYLLTKTEYSFYKILKPICDKHNCLICPKIGLKDFIDITDKTNYYKWFGKINQKHVDFIICDNNLNVLLAIELDDYSHNSQKAQNSDNFKNKIYSTIGLPLKRIKVGNYNDLESILFPKLNTSPTVEGQ